MFENPVIWILSRSTTNKATGLTSEIGSAGPNFSLENEIRALTRGISGWIHKFLVLLN